MDTATATTPLILPSQNAESTPKKLVRKVKCSIKLFVLLIIAVTGLLLVGYIAATLLHLKNGGIEGEIQQLQNQNNVLKVEYSQFKTDNDHLKKAVQNLTSLNHMLNNEVVDFKVQNVRFHNYLKNLNSTNSNLKDQIVELESNEDDMKKEISAFKNKTSVLAKEDSKLQGVEKTLDRQLADFSGLREEVANYSHERQESLDQVMDTTVDLFNNVSSLETMTRRTNLLQIAANCEFLADNQVGFQKVEYDLFLQNSANELKQSWSLLQKEYPYSRLAKNSGGVASWKSVTEVVDQMVQNINLELTARAHAILSSSKYNNH